MLKQEKSLKCEWDLDARYAKERAPVYWAVFETIENCSRNLNFVSDYWPRRSVVTNIRNQLSVNHFQLVGKIMIRTQLLSRTVFTFWGNWETYFVVMMFNTYDDTKMAKGRIWVTILKASCIMSFQLRHDSAAPDSVFKDLCLASRMIGCSTFLNIAVSLSCMHDLIYTQRGTLASSFYYKSWLFVAFLRNMTSTL